jgi:hypothetical protein
VEPDYDDNAANVHKDRLEGVKADGPVLVVGGDHEEENSRDEAQNVTESGGDVIG